MTNYLFILAFLLLLLPFRAVAQSAEVYHWVDENGNVHYSDMPHNPNAKLIAIQPGLTSKADTAQFPESTANSGNTPSVKDLATAQDQLAFRDVPNSAESCRDLRVEMSQRARDLNAGNPEKAQQARIFLAMAEQLLENGSCQ